ncbi:MULTISPECIES: hypothetical protein [unclassified Knoellia]|uniref:hypothetical protein n=1 Tax=Knoellia altitudinis TaxID=3404795 RepID=UPI00361A035B
MRARLVELVHGREVVTTLGVAAVLGLALMLAPALDRVLLIAAGTGLLVVLVGLVAWLVRDHHELRWSTYGGTAQRVRGTDHRLIALTRTIDACLTGDPDASRSVQSVLRSLAQARLAPLGLDLDSPRDQTEAVLGRDLTAYLVSGPRRVDAAGLASFMTTLEER